MNRLKALREKEGLTLRELGEQVNMFSSRLSQYETGKREPKLDRLMVETEHGPKMVSTDAELEYLGNGTWKA